MRTGKSHGIYNGSQAALVADHITESVGVDVGLFQMGADLWEVREIELETLKQAVATPDGWAYAGGETD